MKRKIIEDDDEETNSDQQELIETMREAFLSLNADVREQYYKAYQYVLNEEQSETLAAPLNTFLSETKLSWMKAGLSTYLKRICFPKGMFYWKSVGMSSNLYG